MSAVMAETAIAGQTQLPNGLGNTFDVLGPSTDWYWLGNRTTIERGENTNKILVIFEHFAQMI